MNIEPNTAAVVAGTSGVAAYIVIFEGISSAFLGVPLPVVLAATTGAWFARSIAPTTNFFSAFFRTVGWTIVGCALAPLANAGVKHFFNVDLPTAAHAGLALILSGGLPMVLPVIQQKLPEIVGSWLDKFKGSKGKGE